MWICGCHCMDDLPINGRFRVWKSWRFILGSLILGLMSHTMSRRYKRPVIIFIVPGIIPLVPGGAAYQATRFLVSNDYTSAVNTFLEVTLISGAIAFGILVSEILYYLYTRIKQLYGKIKGKTYKNLTT